MDTPRRTKRRLDRRRFLSRSAGAIAGAGVAALGTRPALGVASPDRGGSPLPTPKPIPGGTDLSGFGLSPPYDFIHWFAPGPKGVVLPFSGGELQGLNTEPSTITNFRGKTAFAYIIGSAHGSNGATYGLEVDIRAMEGTYGTAGSRHRGAFAFI
jgi:hypothetical protein